MSQKVVKEVEADEIPEEVFRRQVREKIKKQRKGSRQGIVGDRPKGGFLAVGKDYLSEDSFEHS